MTSAEIRFLMDAPDFEVNDNRTDFILLEIAYQLAVQNERQGEPRSTSAPELGSGEGVAVDELNRELNALRNPICWRCRKPTTETYHGLCGTCFKLTKESGTANETPEAPKPAPEGK